MTTAARKSRSTKAVNVAPPVAVEQPAAAPANENNSISEAAEARVEAITKSILDLFTNLHLTPAEGAAIAHNVLAACASAGGVNLMQVGIYVAQSFAEIQAQLDQEAAAHNTETN